MQPEVRCSLSNLEKQLEFVKAAGCIAETHYPGIMIVGNTHQGSH